MKAWQVTEHFGIDWPEQAVHEELDEAVLEWAGDSPLSVVDEMGRAVPAQLVRRGDRAQVWYLASLRPHEQKEYVLRRGAVGAGAPLLLAIRGDVAELHNGRFGVCLSWGSGGVARPLAEMPSPICALCGPDGIWFGDGSWRSAAQCRALRCEVVADGPVLAIVRQTYELAEGGEVEFEYRLDAATPAVAVAQRCTSAAVEAQADWEFLQPGRFAPTHAFWRPHSTAEWRGPKDHRSWYRQVYRLRWPEAADTLHLTAFYNWALDGAMFWSCWQEEEEERRDLLLIGAIRPSRTRCPQQYQPLEISCGGEGRCRAALTMPVQEGEKHLFLSVIDRTGALPEAEVPHSRVEGLYRQMHCLGLDEYYHMSLDWEGMRQISFPHLMIAADQVPQVRRTFADWTWLRERLATHVDDRLFATHDQDDMRIRPEVRTLGSDWAGAYLATGEVAYARRAKGQIAERLERWIRELAAVGPTVDQLIGITLARPWRSTCIAFDLVAGSEAFTAAERLSFLRRLAFVAEAAYSGDAWPAPESGLAYPNPNFHPDYFTAKGTGAALLSGHPRQREWMAYAVAEAGAFLRAYHLPGGCAQEAATYQLCSLGYMTLLAVAVRGAGGQDLFSVEPVMKESYAYLASIQTPRDPRTGFHLLPTVGHVTIYGWCQSLQTYFAWAARATAASDPRFSRRMMAAWRRAGSPPISLHDWATDAIWWQPLLLIDRALPEEPDPAWQRSRVHGGLGAVLRAARPGGHEGYLLVKMGSARGHYDADEGSLFWYAYGVPLLADFGCQYNPNIQCSWLHNRISFDRWNEAHGHHFEVLACALGEESDAVCGEMVVRQLHRWEDWPVRRTEADHRIFPPPRSIAPIRWRREVLYVHACEAILVRDRIEGAQPTDWNLQVLAEEGCVGQAQAPSALSSAHFIGQLGVDLDVHIARPRSAAISFSGFEHMGFDEPRLPSYWWKSIQWAAPEGAVYGRLGERAITLRVRAPAPEAGPQQEYLALLLARRAGEPAAAVSVPADGSGFAWADPRGSWRAAPGPAGVGWQVVDDGHPRGSHRRHADPWRP